MAFYREVDEKEKSGRPAPATWPEYGSPTECFRCHGKPWYRVQDFTFPTNPVRRYLCKPCFRDWCGEQRPAEGGLYQYTFRPVLELPGIRVMKEEGVA